MKRCTDREFVYVRSTDTDLRKTFERVRREQEELARKEIERRINHAIDIHRSKR